MSPSESSTESKVSQLQMAIFINENIIWLDIPENNKKHDTVPADF